MSSSEDTPTPTRPPAPDDAGGPEPVSTAASDTGTHDDPGEPGGDPAGPGDTERNVAGLRRELDELRDQLLRRAADFDNYRKRIERERREQIDLSTQDVLLELLPILDDMERAMAVPAPPEADAYKEGVELIYKQLQELLRKRGAVPLDAVGADFDPREHQAVVQEISAAHRDGEVIEEFRRGYRLGERLLRAAMVKVAKREQA